MIGPTVVSGSSIAVRVVRKVLLTPMSLPRLRAHRDVLGEINTQVTAGPHQFMTLVVILYLPPPAPPSLSTPPLSRLLPPPTPIDTIQTVK